MTDKQRDRQVDFPPADSAPSKQFLNLELAECYEGTPLVCRQASSADKMSLMPGSFQAWGGAAGGWRPPDEELVMISRCRCRPQPPLKHCSPPGLEPGHKNRMHTKILLVGLGYIDRYLWVAFQTFERRRGSAQIEWCNLR